MSLTTLNNFVELAKKGEKKVVAVASAADPHVLSAVKAAVDDNICNAVLVGDEQKIKEYADIIEFDLSKTTIINELNPAKAAKACVSLVREGNIQVLMKGQITTADFLRAVLDKEIGLRKGNLLSHVGFFEMENYHKLLALTDAAQNINPSLSDKIDIVNNVVDLLIHLEEPLPKVALLSAVEFVNPKIENTLDWAIITQMNRRNQIPDCIVDGPLAFDNAISKKSAEMKNIKSDVAGDADILVVPNLEVGNILYKSFTYMANAIVAAIIVGAVVPIVLTSRADSEKSKLMSIALASSYKN